MNWDEFKETLEEALNVTDNTEVHELMLRGMEHVRLCSNCKRSYFQKSAKVNERNRYFCTNGCKTNWHDEQKHPNRTKRQHNFVATLNPSS